MCVRWDKIVLCNRIISIQTDEIVSKVSQNLQSDHRLTISCLRSSHGKPGYHKLCSRWVLKIFTNQHKEYGGLAFLESYLRDGNGLVSHIVTEHDI